MSLFPIAQGFVLGASMIIPIGAQNAFILNQGIKRQYHLVAATICMLSDFALITIGIYGGSQIINSSSLASTFLTWAGILFLLCYGGISFKAAFRAPGIPADQNQKILQNAQSLSKVVLTCFAVTLLNPHAYIDTVIILGGVGGQFADDAKLFFTLGCMLASIVWFYGLAMSAARFSDCLSRPRVKKIIDILVGFIMWAIALMLFRGWLLS
jgi:L-lysine exporter family protein LysE/ArgO